MILELDDAEKRTLLSALNHYGSVGMNAVTAMSAKTARDRDGKPIAAADIERAFKASQAAFALQEKIQRLSE